MGCRVQGSGFRVQGSGFRVQGLEFRVLGVGFRAGGIGCIFDASSAPTRNRSPLFETSNSWVGWVKEGNDQTKGYVRGTLWAYSQMRRRGNGAVYARLHKQRHTALMPL